MGRCRFENRIHPHTDQWQPSTATLPDPEMKTEDTLWSGIRTFSMQRAKIHDCEFIDAGGRWKRRGKPGVVGGITGGAIFAIWMKDSEIAHNRFERTQMGKADGFYGIQCVGQSRPLLRSEESHGSVVENNRLTNVSDTGR